MKSLISTALSLVFTASIASNSFTQTAQKPTRFDALPRYLESVLPPSAKGRVNIIGEYVETHFILPDSTDTYERARRIARDFVFAAYDVGLPIRGVKIEIMRPDKTTGLSLALGANVAALFAKEISRASKADSLYFVKWMKAVSLKHKDGLGVDKGYLAGQWVEALANDSPLGEEIISSQRPAVNAQAISQNAAVDEKAHQAVQKALTSLNKIAEGLDAGMSYLQYKPSVREAQLHVLEASRILPDGELKSELRNAVEDYVFAGEVWMASTYPYIYAASDIGRILTEKYSLIPETVQNNKVIRREAAFRALCRSARNHINKASLLQRQ